MLVVAGSTSVCRQSAEEAYMCHELSSFSAIDVLRVSLPVGTPERTDTHRTIGYSISPAARFRDEIW